ncbi:dethiobiotin synthase [Eudoraea chungangensis]|uniref:dethiobiotin synthase n=1 Tax=Eudoraea chungangensis TaxID=1481905 RepID=UPI0023EC6550|nr:dethiobiotin synthase [Eudoraea chungangensis]
MKRIFVTGISTEVGKTIASSIIVEALGADYWKPIQAGDLHYTDSHKVHDLISSDTAVIHPSSYALKTPMSPHAAAEIDGIEIDLEKIQAPETRNTLVIEGAGGLLVPLNNTDTIFDLIKPDYQVIVVSRHYLGSINHTLLTLDTLLNQGFRVSLVFSGEPHSTTESIILSKTRVKMLGRIREEEGFDRKVISKYAAEFSPALKKLLLE